MKKVKDVAIKMMDEKSAERMEAEKMMGKTFDKMTKSERLLAAECLAAFDGIWNSAE